MTQTSETAELPLYKIYQSGNSKFFARIGKLGKTSEKVIWHNSDIALVGLFTTKNKLAGYELILKKDTLVYHLPNHGSEYVHIFSDITINNGNPKALYKDKNSQLYQFNTSGSYNYFFAVRAK